MINRGIIIGAEGENLVVAPTDGEVLAFGVSDLIRLAPAPTGPKFTGKPPQWLEDGMLYDRKGQPAAIVKSWRTHTDSVEVTAFGSNTPLYVPTLTEIRIEAVAVMR